MGIEHIDELIIIRDEMFAELVQIGSEPADAEDQEQNASADRYQLLHDALRQCIDLEELARLVGLDFYTREPQPQHTDDLYWEGK